MKKTILTCLCVLFFLGAYAQRTIKLKQLQPSDTINHIITATNPVQGKYTLEFKDPIEFLTEIGVLPTSGSQQLSISNDTIFLENGGYVVLPISSSSVDNFLVDAFVENNDLKLIVNKNGIDTTLAVDLSSYSNYWIKNGTDITYDGNVGIGTTTPSEKLHVQDGDLLIERSNSTASLLKFGNSENQWIMTNNALGNYIMKPQTIDADYAIRSLLGDFYFRIQSNGRVSLSDLAGKGTGIAQINNAGAFIHLDYSAWDLNASDDFSGSYLDLTNTPTIPTNNNQLTNGAGYITNAAIPTNNNQLTNGAGYITNAAIPTNNNELTNGAGYITNAALPTNNNELTNGAGYTSVKRSFYNSSFSETIINNGIPETLNFVSEFSDASNISNEAAGTFTFTENGKYMISISLELQSDNIGDENEFYLNLFNSSNSSNVGNTRAAKIQDIETFTFVFMATLVNYNDYKFQITNLATSVGDIEVIRFFVEIEKM